MILEPKLCGSVATIIRVNLKILTNPNASKLSKEMAYQIMYDLAEAFEKEAAK